MANNYCRQKTPDAATFDDIVVLYLPHPLTRGERRKIAEAAMEQAQIYMDKYDSASGQEQLNAAKECKPKKKK